ncbi:MAG: hypothetical protein AVDCRST_MAG22-8 [uncultured Rubrobacteraceae bacterium]|uniref:Uncharacterized protein n=1 Tax=uncultured Rubrobacteraceae bacterium TaxID=349277 RepID=A0A6J4N9U7_9ACTN|nr:MAG: hypothetical protein AVDCRST_MAG22-8 [uncultured Rubrobacteraceae bacterium]
MKPLPGAVVAGSGSNKEPSASLVRRAAQSLRESREQGPVGNATKPRSSYLALGGYAKFVRYQARSSPVRFGPGPPPYRNAKVPPDRCG